MRTRRPLRTAGIASVAIVLSLVVAGCSSSSKPKTSTSTAAAGSGPLTTVKIGGSTGGDFALLWIAEQAGFFKAQGLDAKFVNFVGAGAPAITSAFLGGSFDFLNGAVASTMSAKAAGAPMQAVFGVDIGQQIEIAVHNTEAQKLGMPQPDGTAATALKQFLALKGSHIKIGVTSTTSPAYNAIAALAQAHGLTIGVNAASDDIDVITTGTTTAMNTGYLANSYDGMASNPPTTTKPASNIVNMGLISPLSQSAGLYLLASTKYAQANPKVTQGVVNAMVQAWAFAKKNPTQAEQYTVSMQKENQITDPAEIQTLYKDLANYWKTPLMLQSAFTSALDIINTAQAKPISLTYSQWADPTYVNTAVKDKSLTMGVPIPTS